MLCSWFCRVSQYECSGISKNAASVPRFVETWFANVCRVELAYWSKSTVFWPNLICVEERNHSGQLHTTKGHIILCFIITVNFMLMVEVLILRQGPWRPMLFCICPFSQCLVSLFFALSATLTRKYLPLKHCFFMSCYSRFIWTSSSIYQVLGSFGMLCFPSMWAIDVDRWYKHLLKVMKPLGSNK